MLFSKSVMKWSGALLTALSLLTGCDTATMAAFAKGTARAFTLLQNGSEVIVHDDQYGEMHGTVSAEGVIDFEQEKLTCVTKSEAEQLLITCLIKKNEGDAALCPITGQKYVEGVKGVTSHTFKFSFNHNKLVDDLEVNLAGTKIKIPASIDTDGLKALLLKSFPWPLSRYSPYGNWGGTLVTVINGIKHVQILFDSNNFDKKAEELKANCTSPLYAPAETAVPEFPSQSPIPETEAPIAQPEPSAAEPANPVEQLPVSVEEPAAPAAEPISSPEEPVTPPYFGYCSDGIVNNSEECDDGNSSSGDGCSADCMKELATPAEEPQTPVEEPVSEQSGCTEESQGDGSCGHQCNGPEKHLSGDAWYLYGCDSLHDDLKSRDDYYAEVTKKLDARNAESVKAGAEKEQQLAYEQQESSLQAASREAGCYGFGYFTSILLCEGLWWDARQAAIKADQHRQNYNTLYESTVALHGEYSRALDRFREFFPTEKIRVCEGRTKGDHTDPYN